MVLTKNIRRILLGMVIVLAWVSSASAQTVIFEDHFDSYSAGSFPSGWSVYSIGATVSNIRSVSAPNSLRLDGSQGLGAFVYHFP